MNNRQQRLIYLALIAVFFCTIVISIYYLLGGFKEVQITKEGSIQRIIVGKQFNTHYTNTKWVEFGQKCKELVDNGKIKGSLTIITFHPDTLDEKQVSRFVGISLDDTMAEIPEDFEIRRMKTKSRYLAYMDMHVIVQPRPDKVEEMLSTIAAKNSDTLQDFFIEIRHSNGQLEVEGWVKE